MCVGPSMLPTFNHVGDVVVMERVTPFLRSYTRGDVVIAKSPTNANQTVGRMRVTAGTAAAAVAAAATAHMPLRPG